MADRANRILKVKAKTFSIRKLRTLLVEYLQKGSFAWECVKNDEAVGGEAIFRVPNYADGEYGYAVIRYDEIKTGKSYKEWLFKKKNFRKNVLYNPELMNTDASLLAEIKSNGSCDVYNSKSTIYEWKDDLAVGEEDDETGVARTIYDSVPQIGWGSKAGKGGTPTKYTITEAEAFSADADVLFFTMVKQTDEGFEWNDYMDNHRGSTMSKRIKYSKSSGGSENYWDYPPLYPGEGSPAIGASPTFYQDTASIEDTVYIYISMTKHNALIIINYRDYWDMAQIGFFEPFQSMQEYPFPAMAMSSNIGIRPFAEVEKSTVKEYFLYDYTHNNNSYGRAMPTVLATYMPKDKGLINKICNTGLQAISPDGGWVSFANYGIGVEYFYKSSEFYYSFKEPELLGDGVANYTTVYHSDTARVVESKPFRCDYATEGLSADTISEYIKTNDTVTLSLMPIFMVQCKEKNINQNMIGIVPATYWCSNKAYRYGLFEQDGRLWLMVPNCEEYRRWHIIPFFADRLGTITSNEEMISETKRIDKKSESMNTVFDIGINEGVITIRE